MREIKFRGQDFETGEWIYGSYNGVNAGVADVFIIYEKEILDPVSFGFIDTEIVEKEVKEETVGQYTGLKDRHGVEIYEGDILQRESSINRDYHGEWIRDEVIYKPGVFFVSHISSDKGKLPRGYTAGELLSSYFDYDGKLFAFGSDYEPSCFGEVIGNIYENHELLEATQ